MKIRLQSLALLQGLSLCAGLTLMAGCDENVLDPMADRQPRSTRYKESHFYADGLSMRAAPDGSSLATVRVRVSSLMWSVGICGGGTVVDVVGASG